MRDKQILEKIKAFGMTNQMLIEDLTRISSLYAVELGVGVTVGAQSEERCTTRSLNQPYGKRGCRLWLSTHEVFYCLEIFNTRARSPTWRSETAEKTAREGAGFGPSADDSQVRSRVSHTKRGRHGDDEKVFRRT